MSNAASTPEFRKILQALYDSHIYKDSASTLRAAWAEYKWRVQQQRYTMRKTAMGMNPGARWHGSESDKERKKAYSTKGPARDFYAGKMAAHIDSSQVARKLEINPRKFYPYSKEAAKASRQVKNPRQFKHVTLYDRTGKAYRYPSIGDKTPRQIEKEASKFYGVTLIWPGPRTLIYPEAKKYVKKTNPQQFKHERLRSPQSLHHFRTVSTNGHRIIIGCPVKTHKGRCPVPTVLQAILHSKERLNPGIGGYRSVKRCVVCGATVNIIRDKRGRLVCPTHLATKKNPIAIYNPRLTKLPASNIEIRYRRSNGSSRGQWFHHPFKSSVTLYGTPSGDVLIKSKGKRLWGTVN